MNFIDSITDFFDDVECFREGICDILEYATVGFVEEVVKGNGEYKTSYEKRDEASAIHAAATHKLQEASKSLNRTVEELNEKICVLNDRKQRLLTGMNCGVSTVQCRVPMSHPSSMFNSTFSGLNTRSDPISTCIRISIADEYLENARDHRAECDERIARNIITHINPCLTRSIFGKPHT